MVANVRLSRRTMGGLGPVLSSLLSVAIQGNPNCTVSNAKARFLALAGTTPFPVSTLPSEQFKNSIQINA